MATVNAPVQMLWVGGPLSPLERLSLTSWLANGHEVHLYTYGKPANSPKGLRICDAARSFRPRPDTQNSASGQAPVRFSDMFSYALLHSTAASGSTSDVVCLRPLDFAAGMEYFFASEMLPAQPGDGDKLRIRTSGCVMKSPGRQSADQGLPRPGPQARRHRRGLQRPAPAAARRGREVHMTASLLNPNLFCPVPFWNMTALISGMTVLPPESYGVHLWNESWRRNLFDRNARLRSALALVERLKAHYLGRKGTVPCVSDAS
jgi:hypothetical protein